MKPKLIIKPKKKIILKKKEGKVHAPYSKRNSIA